MRPRSTRGSEQLTTGAGHRVLRAQGAGGVHDPAHDHRTRRDRGADRRRAVADRRDPTPIDEDRRAVALHEGREDVVAVLAVVHLVAQQHLVRRVVVARRLGPPPAATADSMFGAGAAYAARALRTSDCLWSLRATCQNPRAMKVTESTSTRRWPATQRGRRSVTAALVSRTAG